MPIYNYQCLDCKENFEIRATLKEKEDKSENKFKCPKCQSKNISQQFSGVNFIKNIFKGNDKGSGGCCSGGGCQCG